MIAVKELLAEIIDSLRNVIAPAIAEPYPKTQAYMAAVILEFVARQVDERSDLAAAKDAALTTLFERLGEAGVLKGDATRGPVTEARLCAVIEDLYRQRATLGDETFTAANQLVRATLRQLLDQDLRVAGSTSG